MEDLIVAQFHIVATHSSRDMALSDYIKGEFFVEYLANCLVLSTSLASILVSCIVGLILAKCVSPQFFV